MEKNDAWKRFKRPWVWGPLVFLCAAAAFYEFEPLRYRDLTVEQPPVCGPEHSGAHHNSKFETAWESDRFVVRATEYPNCAEEFERASVHVVGNRLLLRIRYHSPTGESFACHCRKVTIVRLANLEKRDYRVVRISLLPWP